MCKKLLVLTKSFQSRIDEPALVSNTACKRIHFESSLILVHVVRVIYLFVLDVFVTSSKQRDLYDETFRDLVQSVLDGFNGTIFAYGQTGTGKTFTMQGMECNRMS